MAFETKNLSVLAYANGFTLWHYATSDIVATVESTGYFSDASDMVRVGDIILANVNTNASPGAGILVVATSSGGVVSVSELTPLGAENSL